MYHGRSPPPLHDRAPSVEAQYYERRHAATDQVVRNAAQLAAFAARNEPPLASTAEGSAADTVLVRSPTTAASSSVGHTRPRAASTVDAVPISFADTDVDDGVAGSAHLHHARAPASPHRLRASQILPAAPRLAPPSPSSADRGSYRQTVTASPDPRGGPSSAYGTQHFGPNVPFAATAVPVHECAGCVRLRIELDDVRGLLASMEATVARLTFSVRALTNREASASRSATIDGQPMDAYLMAGTGTPPPPHGANSHHYHHHYEGGAAAASTPHYSSSSVKRGAATNGEFSADGFSPSDPYEAELARSDALREQAARAEGRQHDRHFRAQSPLLRDQQHMVAIKAELRVFEKRMVAAMTKMANRLTAVETDAATLLEGNAQIHETVERSIAALRHDKVSRDELKPLVLPIIDTARDITGERVSNLYALFGWPEARVQQAVASRDPDFATDTVFSSPALARLVDGLVRTSTDVVALRDEVRHLHRVRLMEGPSLSPKMRMLGLAVGDEIDLQGVRVTQVFSGGPGHIAGFRQGDIISMVNNVHVTCKADFLRVMSTVMPNTVVRVVRIARGRSAPEEVEVTASAEPSQAAGAPLY